MARKQQLKKLLLKSSNTTEKTFLEHLGELKIRLIWVVISLFFGSIVGYFLKDDIIKVLLFSGDHPLFYTSPAGGLDFIIRICLLFGLTFSIPVFIYQIIKFIEPVLPEKENFLVIKMLLVSIGLMIAGMSLAYFQSIPAALHFLGRFSTDQIKSLISTNEYLSFVTIYMIGFGLLFQLPLLMLLINRVHKLQIKQLFGWERYIIIASFIMAGILTPTPDLINQILMAIPIILLYQLSIGLIWLTNR